MKKFFSFAVAATIVALCAVMFSSCDERYSEEDRIPTPEVPAKVTSCNVTLNTYGGTGVVKTRATAVEHLDGKLVATSRHLMEISGATVEERTYSGTNTIEARGVLKPRYAKTLDSFKESNLKMSETTFEDGRVGRFINFADGTNHNFYYSFIIENSYDTDTIQVVNSQSGKLETLKRCINEIVDLEFLSQRVTDLQRDSAGWHAYALVHSYAGKLSEGPNNGFQYDVNLPLVWVWKGNDEPKYPDDKPEPIVWEDGDEGFDFVNDSTSQSWKDIIPTLSDGTKGKPDRIAVLLKNTIVEPEYQVKQVEDLSYTELEMQVFDEVKAGDRYDKENKISVQPYMKSVKARTNKCDAIFILKREGAPIYTDSLGGKHYLPERSWSATDDGWTDKSMEPTENFERKLLTSHIIGTFNEHSHPAKGEVELRKVKGEDVKIVGYDYPEDEKGITPIVPNETYSTWRNQYTVFSNGKKEFNGKVSTTLNLKTIAPERQVVTVTDWEINDLQAQGYNATRNSSRTDKQETGTFTIYAWSKKYVTRTNKSSDNFVTTYDGTVTFKDKYGNEVEFLALAVKQEDKGGVATLKNLPEADEMERKSMTTTINVTETNTSTSANHTAEIEFRKAVEKEELTDWKVTNQDLVYNGNGNWTSTTTVTYYWKLAGTKTETYSTGLVWNIVGEAKSQVILDEAKADYRTLNAGSETSSTSTNGNITVVTRKKGYTEDYTTLKDNYTATMQTASYKSTVGGKTIAFDFLSPTGMTVAHANGSLVNGNRTTTKNGTEYNVWDHTGSVTATVVSPKGNQTETATDIKEVLVKKEETPIIPANPEWGYPVGLASNGATLVYRKLVGDSQEGRFHKNLIIKYEKGILVVTTHSYGMDGNNWNPNDFTYTESDFYYYGKQYYGRTLTQSNSINSAILRNDRWEPAAISMDGSGWVYVGISGNTVNMSQNLAVTAGIKNFNGETTAANNPFLRWSGRVDNNKVLTIYNAKGVPVIRFR